jgi:hypothetical protein
MSPTAACIFSLYPSHSRHPAATALTYVLDKKFMGVKQPLPSLNVGGGDVQNGQLGGDPEAGHGGGDHYHHEGPKSGWSVPVSRKTVHRVGQGLETLSRTLVCSLLF